MSTQEVFFALYYISVSLKLEAPRQKESPYATYTFPVSERKDNVARDFPDEALLKGLLKNPRIIIIWVSP